MLDPSPVEIDADFLDLPDDELFAIANERRLADAARIAAAEDSGDPMERLGE